MSFPSYWRFDRRRSYFLPQPTCENKRIEADRSADFETRDAMLSRELVNLAFRNGEKCRNIVYSQGAGFAVDGIRKTHRRLCQFTAHG
jgi:hypothetical protein